MLASTSKESVLSSGLAEPLGKEAKSASPEADVRMDEGSVIKVLETVPEILTACADSWKYEDLDNMCGQPWSTWAEHFKIEPEPDPEVPPRESDCMKLPRQDMPIYGICPEMEHFIGVVCERCEATVHPHGLANHYRKWHSDSSTEVKHILELPEQGPIKKTSNKKGTLCKTKAKRSLVAPISPATVVSPQIVDETLETFENETTLRSPVMQPIVSVNPANSPHSVAPSTQIMSITVQTTAFSSTVDKLPQIQGATATVRRRPKVERKYLPVKEREYDPNKHCGVWIGENNRPCTRSLTCKSHSLSMRRSVSGRSKIFDLLLADHRAAKEALKQKQVCSFSERKFGAMLTNARRLEVIREGLKEALTNGPLRSPLGNDFYGNALQANTNHATATIKSVLTNICTKSNFLGPRGKLLVPHIGISKNHKVSIHSSAIRKSNSILPPTVGNNIQLAGSLKTALQKSQHLAIKPLNQNVSSKEASGKTGQFHVPNILGGSLKRQGEVAKGTTNVKRAKRKPTVNVNPAEILGSLFGRKSMPLVTVAIANGANEAADAKNVFTELQKGTTSSDVKAGATNIKAVTQNVRIAAAPSTVQIAATPQITYLTTTPVTFQQIPVLSQQVISQIQLQTKNSSGGGTQGIPMKLSLATTTTMDHSTSDS